MTPFARTLVAGLALMACSETMAADLAGEPVYYAETARYCRLVHPSPILNLPSLNHIEDAVLQRMDYSINVALDERVIFHRNPAYTWANETKFNCGMALGYLGTREVHPESISKCDCFYSRMLSYLRH